MAFPRTPRGNNPTSDPWNVFADGKRPSSDHLEPHASVPPKPQVQALPETGGMKRIGDILVDAGVITPEIRDRVVEQQEWNHVSFGTALLEMRAMNEKLFLRALSVQTSSPPAAAADLESIPPDVLDLVKKRIVERHAVLPFRRTGRSLHVAMAHPNHNPATKSVALLTGLAVVPHVAIEARLALAIEKHYGIPAGPHFKALVRVLDEMAAPPPAPVPVPGPDPAPAPAARPDVVAAEPPKPVAPKTLAAPPRARSVPVLARTLREAQDADQVAAVLFEGLQGALGSVALFLVREDDVVLWRSWPSRVDAESELRIPFSERSLFALLRDMTGVFAGPCPDTPANRQILASVGGDSRQSVVVIPVGARERTALFVVGGPGRDGATLDKRTLGSLAKAAGTALDRLSRADPPAGS